MSDFLEETNTESARRLVTVQVVTSLEPIEGKDRIELAQVMGWYCIVKKGEFNVGDLCVFHEPDTVVDTRKDCYAFLAPKAKADGKSRIRTMRMGGVLSQGLALPFSILPGTTEDGSMIAYTVGSDVTTILGCEKWEPTSEHGQAMRMCSGARRLWPGNAPPKTDEIRLQSMLGVVSEFEGVKAFATLKLDGSSMTLINTEGHVQLCSRNFEIIMAEDEGGTFTEAVKSLRLNDKLPYGHAVQGELVGPGIQKNRLGLNSVEFRVFNVFSYLDEDDNIFPNKKPRLMGLHAMKQFCQDFGFDMVPIVDDDFKFDTTNPVGDLFNRMKGQNYASGFPVEGWVIRPYVVQASKYVSPWLSVKLINPEYELKVG